MKSLKKIPAFINGATSTFLMLICLITFSVQVKAADYYWVNGGGNWSDYGGHWATTSGGSIFHTTIPTLNDDVFFDGNSFNAPGQVVILDSTFIYCKTMDWSGVTFNPNLSRQSNTKINIYGSLVLSDSMGINFPVFHLLSDSMNNILHSGNISIDSIYFNGMGSWELTGPMNCDLLIFNAGSFNTNGLGLSFIELECNYSNPIIINFDTSTVNFAHIRAISSNIFFNGAGAKFIFQPVGGFTSGVFLLNDTLGSISSNTTLSISGVAYVGEIYSAGNLASGSWSGNNIISSNKITVGGNLQYFDELITDTLIMLNAGVTMDFKSITINNSLQIQGSCENPVTLLPAIGLSTAEIISPAISMSVEFVVLNNIQSSGAGILTANNSYGIGNNSGWIINSPTQRNLYWIGGTGNWSDPANWALSSGGSGGNCSPSPLDNIYFDANSFTGINDTVKMDVGPAYCNNMNWTGATGSPVLRKTISSSFDLEINGSLVGISSLKIWGLFDMVGSVPGNTITSNSMVIPGINFTGSGTWQLSDPLNAIGQVTVSKGIFQTNGYPVRCESFVFGSNWDTPVVELDTSTIFCTEQFTGGYNDQYILVGNNASVVLNDTTGFTTTSISGINLLLKDITFITPGSLGGVITCNKLTASDGLNAPNSLITSGHLSISGNATLDTCFTDSLIFNNPGSFLKFKDITINDYCEISGTCGNPVNMEPAFGIQIATLRKNSGSITIDHCLLSNISATGGALFNASNSFDLGGNSGWSINSPLSRNLFWVAGTGNWSDGSHWSLSSGGPGGNCPPSVFDNVHFDSNSFINAGDSIFVDINYVSCHHMDWSGANNPTFLKNNILGSNSELEISGSFILSPGMNFAYNGLINFNASDTNSIITNGVSFMTTSYFKGGGTWNMVGDLQAGVLNFYKSTFNTNNYTIDAFSFQQAILNNLYDTVYFNLGTSTFYIYNFKTTNESGTPQLFFKQGSDNLLSSLNLTYNNIEFPENATVRGTFTVNDLVAHKNISFSGTFSANSLIVKNDFSISLGSSLTANDILFKGNVTYTHQSAIVNAGSVHFNNPGKTVLIRNLNISNYFTTTANAGFPVLFKGFNGNGTITKLSGIVCLNYLLLENITATGGAQFNAGANSVNLGGSSGWSFNTCVNAPPDVWPGDANYDLIVNNFDILNIGLAYNFAGSIRPGASLSWVAQPSPDWFAQFANATNLKHADTDGNAIISNQDTAAVSLNYGLTHPLRLSGLTNTSLPGAPLYAVATPDTVMEGDTVLIDIVLGTSQFPVDSIYGLAFTLSFDITMIDSTFLPFDYNGSWMGIPGIDLLTFEKKFVSQGVVDIAITRTDHLNLGGFGVVVSTGVVIIDNIGARLSNAPPYVTLPVTISNVRAVTASEYYFPLSAQGTNVAIDTLGSTGMPDFVLDNVPVIFPNPASESIIINAGPDRIQQVEVIDNLGKVRLGLVGNESAYTVDTRILGSGVYILKITTSTGLFLKKLIITQKK